MAGHDGADRAGRRLRRRRRPHQGGAAARRHLAHQPASSGSSPAPSPTSTSNIVHFVLARPRGAGPGTKGLSLFVVPKFHVDIETGELGERNGAFVTNVEHKMGLKVSTTCEVRFGEVDGIPAVGTLLGDVHDGIAQMFRIIEFARMMVGHQGDRDAVDRLPERARVRQGARAGRRPDPDDRQGGAARHDHPPPRRAPLADAAEGVRRGPAGAGALHGVPAGHHRARPRPAGDDRTARRAGRTGERPAAADRQGRRVRAGLGAARHREPADLRRLRASCRTTRSSSTSATPRSTPSTRAPRRSRASTSSSARSSGTRGRRSAHLSTQIQEFVKGDAGYGELAAERELLAAGPGGHPGHRRVHGRPADGVRPAAAEAATREPLQGRPEHHAAAARHRRPGGRLAAAAPGRGGDRRAGCRPVGRRRSRFYQGKIAAARFFARQVLPRLAAERAIAEATDNELMDLDEAAF